MTNTPFNLMRDGAEPLRLDPADDDVLIVALGSPGWVDFVHGLERMVDIGVPPREALRVCAANQRASNGTPVIETIARVCGRSEGHVRGVLRAAGVTAVTRHDSAVTLPEQGCDSAASEQVDDVREDHSRYVTHPVTVQ